MLIFFPISIAIAITIKPVPGEKSTEKDRCCSTTASTGLARVVSRFTSIVSGSVVDGAGAAIADFCGVGRDGNGGAAIIGGQLDGRERCWC